MSCSKGARDLEVLTSRDRSMKGATSISGYCRRERIHVTYLPSKESGHEITSVSVGHVSSRDVLLGPLSKYSLSSADILGYM